MSDQVLPQNQDAERAVLGGCIVDNTRLPAAAEVLRAEHFYRKAHRLVWEALVRLDAERLPIDLVTVREALERAQTLEDVGGPAYLAGLIDGVPRATNVGAYASIVVEKARLRSLIFAANRLAADAYEGEASPDALIAQTERTLLGLRGESRGRGWVSADTWMAETTAAVMRLAEQRREITGVPSGFHALDHMTRGFQPGDMVIIAGRPSMGKTAFVQQVLLQAAATQAVGFFSLEMSSELLGLRTAALASRIPIRRILAGRLEPQDYGQLMAGLEDVGRSGLFLDDQPNLTVDEIRARLRRLVLELGDTHLAIVGIDYLQLLQPAVPHKNREREVAVMSSTIKSIARELGIAILVLCQLNRQNESRADKRPQLSDLRESGALEQDADTVLLLHRPEYYETTPAYPGLAEVIVAKQRNGPTGTVELRFHKTETRFSAWDGGPTS